MSVVKRRDILKEIFARKPIDVVQGKSLYEIWATDVFDLSKMKNVLPKQIFKSLEKTVEVGVPLEKGVADEIAAAMRNWAISHGAKFYSHVFHPLTGATAEKHDGFIAINRDGEILTEFSSKQLIQGEPDASSFPNGGIRSTFEARGYTAWDVTSPAYIMETANGKTLCIPTVFVSWTGEALDKKTPLLRSNIAISRSANRILKLFGHPDASISTSAGPEQEYFLIDRAFAAARPDLLLAGRTLFGRPGAKGQEFGDHYFGAIPQRVQVFMHDVEEKFYRLGIPAKTHHNEVAPAQFEIAPLYENSNISSDHQQLVMTILKNVARKHGFICLLHEKPFKGVNGSGKHVNWSIRSSVLGNLLDPGDTPHANMQFLLFCAAVIRGVHKYGHLLRATVASASNDHRLGQNEAPPAIMSIYLGAQLADVFERICKGTGHANAPISTFVNIGVDSLPPLPKDPGDRNRTSPFAFTGNRFEFRAVGASQSISDSLVAINTIVSDSLDWIADKLEAGIAAGKKLENACTDVLKEILENHSAVIFNGNGYSEEWIEEAERRGLRNLRTCAEALPVLNEKDIISLFETQKVITPVELAARYEISIDQYVKTIDVEAKLVLEIAKTKILPSVIAYLTDQVECFESLGEFRLDRSNINFVAEKLKDLQSSVAKLEKDLDISHNGSFEEQLNFHSKTIVADMNAVRAAADALEGEVADDFWPLPSYMEMLFIR
ncbi:MAG: glutamine synthetase III [Fibromonadales bacterium]|nr:glutamine synthetase III [Fibromonadales bacterium]